MASFMFNIVARLCVVFCFLMPDLATASADREWSLSFYGAKWSDNRFVEIIRGETKLRSSHLAAVAVSYEFDSICDLFSAELEGNIARHFGVQDHYEVNMILIGRWLAFPWDNMLPTTLAFGSGPSLALGTPVLERDDEDGRVSRFLNFLLAEITVGHPRHPDWSAFLRIHHRSGAGGWLGGITGGSNFVGLGIRHHF